MPRRIITVEKDSGKRIDQILKDNIPGFSRARLQKIIRDGKCALDGSPILEPDYKPRPGQVLEMDLTEESTAILPEFEDLDIVWQDADLVVCNKPAGLTVHPCPSCPGNTLAQRLLGHFPQLSAMPGDRPGIAHRLDKDTSGLITCALNEKTRLQLVEEFARRRVKKYYLALVAGVPPETGECAEPVGRHMSLRTKMAIVPENHGGKPARTSWKKLWQSPDRKFSLLAIRIYTGRTHQIRVHMAFLGHPLLGDKVYAPAPVRAMAPRQMLHSWQLGLIHPGTGKFLQFIASPPDDFFQAIQSNTGAMPRVVVTGNPGCGKSSFCQELGKLGFPVIDADAIVARLYAPNGDVAHWLKMRGHENALAPDNSVSKQAMLHLLDQSPTTRRELENCVHALVGEHILSFWEEMEKKGQPGAIAEIPLYFECGWNKNNPSNTITVGIHCPRKERWQRVMANRGWSLDKTATIEKWQMPEETKMSLCDIVYSNTGNPRQLENDARDFSEKLVTIKSVEEEKLLSRIKDLCSKAVDDMHPDH